MSEVTLETFQKPESLRYKAVTGEDAVEVVELELAEAAELKTGGRREGARKPFSLLFRGPPEPILPQSTYRLEHDELGAMEIFLVPIGSNDEATEYEAVFT